MNSKGQVAVGMLIMSFIAVIVGITLLLALIPSTSNLTTLSNTYNDSVTAGMGINVTLTGQKATNVVPTNQSTGGILPTTNYTVENNVILTDGTLGSRIRFKEGNLIGAKVNMSYTYEPLGYADDSATRSIVPLILIFGALAILVFVLTPTLRSGIIDFMNR